jgi:hypothetical protein
MRLRQELRGQRMLGHQRLRRDWACAILHHREPDKRQQPVKPLLPHLLIHLHPVPHDFEHRLLLRVKIVRLDQLR